MKAALEKDFPSSVEWWEPAGGLYFWARLPRHVPTGLKAKVFQAALKNDVLYVPGELCYADDPSRKKPDHEMRLSFGSASEQDIREGVRRLGMVLRKRVLSRSDTRKLASYEVAGRKRKMFVEAF
jgi:2-aminoadipate transaminase